jgi:hypothetical protein
MVGQSLYRIRTDLAWRDVQDEVVVLETDSGQYFTINNTGRQLWYQLSEAISADALVAHLRSEYDLEQHIAQSDVATFLDQCVGDRLIDVLEEPEP